MDLGLSCGLSFVAQTDYTGPLSGEYKIIRGGSWEGNTRYVRVMYRGKTLPSSKSDNLGFRVVRSIIRYYPFFTK